MLLIMLLGVIPFAIGTGVYAAASLGRGSYEALTFSLAEKNGWQVKTVRMVLELSKTNWVVSFILCYTIQGIADILQSEWR